MHYKEPQYGFEWGSARLQRLLSDGDKGWVAIGIDTPKVHGMQIYITKTGKIRISDERGEWSCPAKEEVK